MMLRRLFPEERCAAETMRRGGLFEEAVAFLFAYLFLLLFPSLSQLFLSPFFPKTAPLVSLFFTAAALLPLLLFLRIFSRAKAEAFYLSRGSIRVKGLLYFPLGIALFVFLVGLLCLTGAFKYVGASRESLSYLPLLFFAYLVQGSTEELLCRGFLLSALSARFGGAVSALISAAVFSLMHVFNPAISLIGLLNIFLFGLLFASLTQRTKSLLPAALLHAGWNFSLSLFGVRISGTMPAFSVFFFENRRPFLSGANFGPEASPLLSVALIAILFLLAFLKPRPICKYEAEK
ncbi:MAG: CPBP family intramembrane metalloprotease [Clostridia bacterium]|nr:CPBP family intramembrane metalloprotease [Clostridia bacterium]